MPVTKGVMGFVDLGSTWNIGSGGGQLRVTSAGLRAVQDITAMETIDSTYDYTAYRLGPVRVEGDIAFPVPAVGDFMLNIVKAAAERYNFGASGANIPGQLKNSGSVTTYYDHTIGYTYNNCKINTMSVNIASEEAVEVTWSLIGRDRTAASGGGSRAAHLDRNAPERVLTWNDTKVASASLNATTSGGSATSLSSSQVRSFSFEINNNLTAFFGLNGEIFVAAANIVAGKREVSGSIEAAWNGSGLQNYAYVMNAGGGSSGSPIGGTHRCSSDDKLLCGFTKCTGGESGIPSFTGTALWLRFNGVVFNMEDISVTNDFFMGTQAWRAYGEKVASGTPNRYSAISYNDTGTISTVPTSFTNHL